MKRALSIFLICMFIFVSPAKSECAVLENASNDRYVPAMAEEIQRVYGIDYSRQIFNSVSLNSFRDFVIKLTENGSRPAGAPADLGEKNIAARHWIVDELQAVSNGRIEVEVLGDYASVLGKLPGYLPVEAPALMVGGHYDSVAGASGANDDATGVAAALELARVMSMYNWPLDIYFGAWNAEEVGLLGSTEVSHILRDRDVELLAYYNIDMLFVPDPDAPPGGDILMAYPVGFYHEGGYWADLTRMMSWNYGHHMIQPIMSSDFSGWQRSDHWPFVQQGYTALFAHESGFEYDDVWNNPLYDYQIATETVKAIGSAMAFTMARAFGEPTRHNIGFTLIPSHNRNYTVTISTPTTINVTCRWWGGGTAISLYDTNDQLLTQMVDFDSSPWEQNQIISQAVDSEGIYRLHIINYGGTIVGHEIGISYETDINGNDIPDSEEFWFDQEYFTTDLDLDTISDAQEMLIGTLHNSNDSDSDSLPDPWEIEHGLDPLDPSDATGDQDSDGVLNLVEYLYNCNPNDPDSDSDTMSDLWEIENDLDPTIDDSLEDPDNDAVTNVKEYEDGTDPHFAEFRPERFVVPTLVVSSVAVIVLVTYQMIRRRT
ncbi:MAG: M28 family peptidase [Candidatus Thorarchaeota archaeon]